MQKGSVKISINYRGKETRRKRKEEEMIAKKENLHLSEKRFSTFSSTSSTNSSTPF